jgi:DNA processing protein
MNKLILVSLSRLRFLKAPEKLLVADCIDDEKKFSALTPEGLCRLAGRKLQIRSWDAAAVLRQGERDLRFAEGRGIGLCCYWDRDYPPLLREIYDPPVLLFYRGRLPGGDRPLAAAVGTRRPSGKAVKAAYRCGLELGINGIGTVSGLARGIDKAVHRGSIDGGGITIAVLGCGIDRVYPAEHKRLAEGILESGGGILSEYAPGTAPARYHFPERNRIISGLARAVIVVQAPPKSGALITADYALEQGRDLFVHRQGLDGLTGAGGRKLAEEGAEIIGSAADFLPEWGFPVPRRVTAAAPGSGARLARCLEEELAGKQFSRMGEYWVTV